MEKPLSEIVSRRNALVCQVLKTWEPPRRGRGSDADKVQTSVMQAVAFIFGPDVLPDDLTANQKCAIDEGLVAFDKWLASVPKIGGE